MKILLTNDDSHQSPLLAFIIENIKKFADLTIVVPKHEQSWKGKSMTRFGYLHLEEMELYGEKAYTVDGTPADCVNIGAYHLFDGKKPDLIISGINAGLNAGLGFLWSSGTVGACLEANIAKIPAIAFSQHFDSRTREDYVATYAIADETYERLRVQTDVFLNKLLNLFLVDKKSLLEKPLTWNINFPFVVNPNARYVVCSCGQSFYGSCYSKSPVNSEIAPAYKGVRFEHELLDISTDLSEGSDSSSLLDGHITISPIDITTFAQLGAQDYSDLSSIFS